MIINNQIYEEEERENNKTTQNNFIYNQTYKEEERKSNEMIIKNKTVEVGENNNITSKNRNDHKRKKIE